MEAFKKMTEKFVAIPTNDIDTDQIIPAQYLKVTSRDGLLPGLFQSWRYLADGSLNPEFPMNKPEHEGATILLAGDNFGCGSSREHAPWALMAGGFKAIVSTSFADIFRNNALQNGLLPVIVDEETHKQLFSIIEEDPSTELTINLEDQTLELPDGRKVEFPIDGFSKKCMIQGVDQLGYLLSLDDKISEFEAAL